MQSLKTMFLGFLVMFLGLIVHFSVDPVSAGFITLSLLVIGWIIALVGYFRKG